MYMLSKEDILKELGKNIFIYPFDNPISTIQGSSVDLTISKFAWSIKSKTSAYNKNTNEIVFDSHDIICAYTEEVLYVKNKIGGVYTSTVSNCAKGISPISTNLDPEYIGMSMLILHNITDEEIRIKVGWPIVSVQFFYLNTPVYVRECNIRHDALISSLIDGNDLLIQEFNRLPVEQSWMYDRRSLITKYQDKEFAEKLKKYIKSQRETFSFRHKFFTSKIVRYCLTIAGAVVLYFVMDLLSKIANVSVPDVSKALISMVFSIISNDYLKEKQ